MKMKKKFTTMLQTKKQLSLVNQILFKKTPIVQFHSEGP